MEGSGVLDEVSGSLGVVLWQRLRDVHLWATATPNSRADLFHPPAQPLDTSDVPEALVGPIALLSSLASQPQTADSVSKACLAISGWAAEHGYLTTEHSFAEVAALADLTNSECAYVAGRAARRRGLYEHGREWFRRAIGLARRKGDDAAYSLAYLAWALLEAQAGNDAVARRKLVRAWRSAKHGRVHRLMGMTRQAMIPYAVAEGDQDAAFRHTVAAARFLGDDEDDLPRVASDAGALFSLYGHFTVALSLYDAAFPRLLRPADRVAGLANIGRAAAALGQRARFEECWNGFQEALATQGGEHLLPSMLEIAEGARTLGQLTRATGIARQVARLAEGKGSVGIRALAEALERAVREGAQVDRDRKAPVAVRRFAKALVARVETAFPNPAP